MTKQIILLASILAVVIAAPAKPAPITTTVSAIHLGETVSLVCKSSSKSFISNNTDGNNAFAQTKAVPSLVKVKSKAIFTQAGTISDNLISLSSAEIPKDGVPMYLAKQAADSNQLMFKPFEDTAEFKNSASFKMIESRIPNYFTLEISGKFISLKEPNELELQIIDPSVDPSGAWKKRSWLITTPSAVHIQTKVGGRYLHVTGTSNIQLVTNEMSVTGVITELNPGLSCEGKSFVYSNSDVTIDNRYLQTNNQYTDKAISFGNIDPDSARLATFTIVETKGFTKLHQAEFYFMARSSTIESVRGESEEDPKLFKFIHQ